MKIVIQKLGLLFLGGIFFIWGAMPSFAQSSPTAVVLSNSEAYLSWNYTYSSNIEFEIERQVIGEPAWQHLSTIRPNTGNNYSNYLDDTTLCGISYVYRVRVHRISDNVYSAYSNLSSVANYPCASALNSEVCSFAPIAIDIDSMTQSYTLSGDGNRIFVNRYLSSDATEVRIYDANTAVLLDTVSGMNISEVSDDGSRFPFIEINSGESNDVLKLWTNGVVETIAQFSYITSASISGDGSSLAFVATDEAGDLYTLYLWQEGLGYEVVQSELYYPEQMKISGDGTTIAFTAYPNYPATTYYDTLPRIYRWDAVNGLSNLGSLEPGDSRIDFLASTSLNVNTDGSAISFSTLYESHHGFLSGQIYSWRADEGLVAIIDNFDEFESYYFYNEQSLGWSADGNRLFFMSTADLTGENPDYSTEYFFRDGTGIHQITSNMRSVPVIALSAISNDGSRVLLYTQYPSPSSPSNLLTSPFQLVIGTCFSPTLMASLSPVSNLTGLSAGQNQINLSWTDSSDETSYILERLATFGWMEIAELPANTNFYSHSSLACGSQYQYRLRAYRSSDGRYSDTSSVSAVTAPCAAPVAPSSIQLSNIQEGSIRVSWRDNAWDESKYIIERVVGPPPTESSGSGTSSSSTGSTGSSGSTTSGTSSSGTSSVLSMGRSDSGTSDIGLLSGSDSAGTWYVVGEVAADSTSFVDSVRCGTYYTYRVRAYRESDNSYSAYSSYLISTTSSPCGDFSPENLSVTEITASSISLEWDDTASNESNYRIERSSNNGSSWVEIAQLPTDSSSFSDTGLYCDTSYRYRLRAYRSIDNRYSNYISSPTLITSGCSETGMPTELEVVSSSNLVINLSWVDNADDEEGFILERREQTASGSANSWEVIANISANSSSYTDTSGLSCGYYYSYRVRAIKAGNRSLPSNEAIGYLQCAAANAPTNLRETQRGDDLIVLRWSNSSSVTGYEIERSVDAGASWQQIAQYAGTGYVDRTVNCGTTYQYRVRSYRSYDNSFSAYSNTLTVSSLSCPGFAAPSGLESTGTTVNSISLDWTDNSSDETAFIVEMSLDDVQWTVLASVPANSNSYTATGLVCATEYLFRVRAYRASDNIYSGYSLLADAVAGACPNLNVPNALTVSATGSNSVGLSWTDNNNLETGYRLERSSDGSVWTEVGQIAANTSGYTDNSVACNSGYQYRLRAYRSQDNTYSDYSNSVSATTLACTPNSPSNLSISATTTTSISLAWTDNASDESNYRIERSSDGSSWSQIAQISANSSSYTNSSIICDRSYQYRVRAYRSGDSSYSSYSNVAIAACPAPADASNLSYSMIGSTTVLLSWTDNANSETNYHVEFLSSLGSWYYTTQVGINGYGAYLYNVVCGSSITYRVRTYRDYDEQFSVNPPQITVTTPLCALKAPTGLTVTASSDSSVSLVWVDTALDETSYRLERSVNGTSWTEIANLASEASGYDDNGLTCGLYYYRVRAYRSGDNSYSTYSNTVFASILPCSPLSSPTNLAGSLSGNTVSFSWLDSNSSETGFSLEISSDGGASWQEAAHVGANASSYNYSLSACGASYMFRIRAYRINDNNYSDYSNTVSLQALPCTPSNLSITEISAGNVTLSWTDNSLNETGYRLERSTNAGTSWTEIASLAADTVSYNDSGVLCYQYRYRVRAYRAEDNQFSSYSNVAYLTCPPPVAPSNLVVTSRSSDSISMSWLDNASDEIYYNVDRSSNGGVTWTMWTLFANATSYTHSSLNCNSSYQYRVRAYRVSDSSYSEYSNTLTVSTLECPPNSPTNLSITDNGDGNISLNWQDNAGNETGYRLERSTNAGTSWTEIAQLAANTVSFSDSGVLCSQYRYRVRASGATDVYSPYSNTVYLPCPPPIAPSNLIQSGSTVTSITLAWTDNATGEDYNRLEMSMDEGLSWSWATNVAASLTSYTQSSLLCGKSYLYRIRAYRSSDAVYSDYSNTLTARTLPCAPTGLTVTDNSGGNVTLNWLDNSSDETAYLLERSTNAGSSWAEIASLAADAVSYNDSGVVCSQYRYRVRAYREIDNKYSAYSSVAYLPCSAPTAPSNLVMTGRSSNSISMSWTDNASGETAYYVERSSNGGVSWSSWSLAANSTSYTHSSLNCNSNYQYRVRAYRSGDAVYSGYSNVLVEMTLACPPTAPSNLTITDNSGGNITLNWMDNASNETGYRLERSTNAGSSWTEIAQLSADSVTFNDTAVLCSQYRYRVRAAGATDVYSAYSNVVYLPCPAPNTPSNLVLSSKSNNSISMSWTDNATDETAYYVERSSNGGVSWSSWSLAANTTSYTHSSLSCNSSYQYRVRAYRSGDAVYSSYSNVLAESTLACPPTAPSNLTITDNSGGNITLNWLDNANNETGYRLERSSNAGSSWAEIAQLDADAISYNDSGVVCSQYRYRVRAVGATDVYSSYSNVVYLPCPPPNTPSNLRVMTTALTYLMVTWNDNSSDESSFWVERSSDNGTSWTVLGFQFTNSNAYQDSTIACGTGYLYRVRAYRSSDNVYSDYSNQLSVNTANCLPAPSNLTSPSQSSTSISLNWTDNASDETNYRIYRILDNGAHTLVVQIPANSTSYTLTGLTCNTNYTYFMAAYRSGDGAVSSYSSSITVATAVCVTLNAPTNFVRTSSSAFSQSFSWTDNSINESGYELERSLDGTNWQLIASLAANSTSYVDTNLDCQTAYRYRLRSRHAGNNSYSPYGNGGIYMTQTCPALVASSLSGTGNSINSISLSWTIDNTANSFTLYYNNGGQWQSLGTFTRNSSSYTHSGLNCGQSYQYRILSYRLVDGSNLYSGTFSAATQACPTLAAPNAPIVVNADAALISLQIPTLPTGASSLRLERSIDGLSWTGLGTVISYYVDTAVSCGTSYQYRLVAYRASDGQSSPASAVTSAMTLSCPIAVNHLVGIYRGGQWIFVDSNDSANPAISFSLGEGQWQPLVGDWDGDGVDGIGLYRNGEFILRDTATGAMSEERFNFGEVQSGWLPVAGDWNGDGIDSVGLYKAGLFILSDDNLNQNYRFNLGDAQAGWLPVAGDWDGNGTDGVGLYKAGLWYLTDSALNPIPQMINYGPNQAGWLPVAGDWNGDGLDTIGLYKDGFWRMRLESNITGTELSLNFGQAGDIPLAIIESETSALSSFAAPISVSPEVELPATEVPATTPEAPLPSEEPLPTAIPTEPEAEVTAEATENP